MVTFINILLQPIPAMIALIAISRYNNLRITHPNPKKSVPKNPYFVRGGAEFEAIRYISIFYYFITLVFIFDIQSGSKLYIQVYFIGFLN